MIFYAGDFDHKALIERKHSPRVKSGGQGLAQRDNWRTKLLLLLGPTTLDESTFRALLS